MILLIFLLNILLTFCSSVTTPFGSIDGMMHPSHSGVEVFMGIPFAQPPIGNLRWEPPQPITSLPNPDSPFNATSFGSVCAQPSQITLLMFGKEDCLYLNIYRPTGYTGLPLPVMLWIHGGGYVEGSGDIYDPLNIVLDGSVIVVTINYRLGFFGFASTGDNHLPGNYGLLDQQLAIKFTTEIISSFGGNPNEITIFGESAGGGSVILQLLSPLNQGLLQGGISQSGAYPLGLSPSNLDGICQTVSGCSSPFIPLKGVETLRNASMNEIFIALDNVATDNSSIPMVFGPAPHDGVFFPDNVNQIIASESFDCSDFIGGWNDRDGNLVSYFVADQDNISETTFGTSMETTSEWLNLEWNAPQKKVLYEKYSGMSGMGKWEDFLTDGMFMKTVIDIVKAFTKKGCPNVYSYRFSVVPQTNFFKTRIPGAGHGDELGYLFSFPNNHTQQEVDISNRIREYWVSFARQNLTSDWPAYNTGNMILDIDFGTTRRNITSEVDDTYSFWSYVAMLPATTTSPTSSPTASAPTPQISGAINQRPLFVLAFMLMLIMFNL